MCRDARIFATWTGNQHGYTSKKRRGQTTHVVWWVRCLAVGRADSGTTGIEVVSRIQLEAEYRADIRSGGVATRSPARPVLVLLGGAQLVELLWWLRYTERSTSDRPCGHFSAVVLCHSEGFRKGLGLARVILGLCCFQGVGYDLRIGFPLESIVRGAGYDSRVPIFPELSYHGPYTLPRAKLRRWLVT